VKEGMKVTFTDPAMEVERQRKVAENLDSQ
jgi:hypothetical protein